MYTAYFGLSEVPFSIAPDPAYLFMSDRHREALAHLSYGLGDNGGFVLLTGEVGTGKTTISRSVMEKLPENTQAAFILNPTLSCEELLATICDSLKIRYKKTGATLKYLTDKIQDKLLKNHQENINTLLIIDEAQHLKPEVLEQLRLLTNLETNTKKLLQVILIGQPELQQLLQRRDLRQLAQRITARYHLLPLTKAELTQYISHRLSVAHCTRALFNQGAIAMVHIISKGIPRVVNLLCDRALIIAYGKNNTVVNKKIVIQAAVEALGADGEVNSFWLNPAMKVAYLSVMISCAIGVGIWIGFSRQPTLELAQENTNIVSAIEQESSVNQKSSVNPNNSVSQKAERITEANTKEESAAIQTQASNNQLSDKLAQSDNNNEKSQHQLVKDQELSNIASDNTIKTLNNNDAEVVLQPKILGYQPEKVTLSSNEKGYEIVAPEGVSDDLLARFKAAVKETTPTQSEENTTNEPFKNDDLSHRLTSQGATNDEQSFKTIAQMPTRFQDSLPTLQFEMHMYATHGEGWVRVNGRDKREGEVIAQGVILERILPQQVILSFENEQFSMPALSNW